MCVFIPYSKIISAYCAQLCFNAQQDCSESFHERSKNEFVGYNYREESEGEEEKGVLLPM